MELIIQPQSLILPPAMIQPPGIILPEPMVVIDSLADSANFSREEIEIIKALSPDAAALLSITQNRS